MPDRMSQGTLLAGLKRKSSALLPARWGSWANSAVRTLRWTASSWFIQITSSRFCLAKSITRSAFPSFGFSQPWGCHRTQMGCFVYVTNVIREADFVSSDQQSFFYQLLVQRLDGPGERAGHASRELACRPNPTGTKN